MTIYGSPHMTIYILKTTILDCRNLSLQKTKCQYMQTVGCVTKHKDGALALMRVANYIANMHSHDTAHTHPSVSWMMSRQLQLFVCTWTLPTWQHLLTVRSRLILIFRPRSMAESEIEIAFFLSVNHRLQQTLLVCQDSIWTVVGWRSR